MLDLDRIIGAAVEDPAACVVFERFMGRLWSCKWGSKWGCTSGAVGGQNVLPAGPAVGETGGRLWRCGALRRDLTGHCFRVKDPMAASGCSHGLDRSHGW